MNGGRAGGGGRGSRRRCGRGSEGGGAGRPVGGGQGDGVSLPGPEGESGQGGTPRGSVTSCSGTTTPTRPAEVVVVDQVARDRGVAGERRVRVAHRDSSCPAGAERARSRAARPRAPRQGGLV